MSGYAKSPQIIHAQAVRYGWVIEEEQPEGARYTRNGRTVSVHFTADDRVKAVFLDNAPRQCRDRDTALILLQLHGSAQ